MAAVFAAVGLLGALLLIVAEFTTLYSVKVAGRNVVAIQAETAGAHNSYAMLPIAVVAAGLAVVAFRSQSRAALLALAVLGIAAILIAVLGDLPDSRAHGLTRHYQLASNSPGPGLYLETLGGVLLLLAGGLGLTSGFGLAGSRGPGARTPPAGSRGPGARTPPAGSRGPGARTPPAGARPSANRPKNRG